MNPELSPREREITVLVCQGLESLEIAGILGVAVSTVKFHLTNIFKKKDVKTRYELMAKIRRNLAESKPKE